MASGIQRGATHAKVNWSETRFSEWVGTPTVAVVDEGYGKDDEVFLAFDPFVTRVVVASSWYHAYEVLIDAIADSLLIDEETLKDYVIGHDSEGNPEYSEVEWTSGGEAVNTTYVSLHQIPTAALTWLYRP